MKINKVKLIKITEMRVVICILFASLVAYPSFLTGQAKPTLKETIDFLRPKLTGRFYLVGGYDDCSIDFDFKTCIMIYKREGMQFNTVSKSKITIPIKDINYKDIVYDPKFFTITLNVNNQENLIIHESTYGNKIDDRKLSYVRLLNLNKENPNSGEKITEALIHLIKLCGGKGEAF